MKVGLNNPTIYYGPDNIYMRSNFFLFFFKIPISLLESCLYEQIVPLLA